MMKNRMILAIGLLLSCGIALSSCTKNDESTITLIGTEYYIDDILSVVPDSLETKFFSVFGSIPSGAIPPKIEGGFVMSPKQRLCSNMSEWPLATVEPNVFMRFAGQHNGIVAMDLNEATETLTDTVFVQGGGNSFVVYFIEDKDYELELDNHTYQVRTKRGVVMKGKVTDNGFTDFRYATIVMEAEDNTGGLIEQYPRGSYFIYKDGDGTVERQEW
jgi:hypothetical protein